MRAGIALGSNLGDRLAHLRTARERLLALHEGADAEFLVSSVRETEPVGCPPGSGAFLNAVIEIVTTLDPFILLHEAQAIERRLGRPNQRAKNSPRTVDVDLLYAGDITLDDPRLVLPHPELRKRRFVLEPLAEIRPDLQLPGFDTSVAGLLEALAAETSGATPSKTIDWESAS
ncbi:MAG: 2-amino-4-hydroxy-6-hydroxymethyldihydropteridine diphosphokinase [Verrucomicrobiae bacterium]|nr:2-amino-4-hydroxy-6-hydroxymethyldihydropteridine diphosphokinase [Verrucomicrobiae bacterium]MCP5541483.1 2-amino-4-hydroxy-6-hydroxymethyldihydropteridine diphosphokinase [Akkermansiaceae bacterium]MCP5550332.1 2-amino-4-hydroxy-6-hydroxymethyldihydropteridine diphosphokinase [Akkermansiaceae bacterium]